MVATVPTRTEAQVYSAHSLRANRPQFPAHCLAQRPAALPVSPQQQETSSAINARISSSHPPRKIEIPLFTIVRHFPYDLTPRVPFGRFSLIYQHRINSDSAFNPFSPLPPPHHRRSEEHTSE